MPLVLRGVKNECVGVRENHEAGVMLLISALWLELIADDFLFCFVLLCIIVQIISCAGWTHFLLKVVGCFYFFLSGPHS